jgi:hypothetical protein
MLTGECHEIFAFSLFHQTIHHTWAADSRANALLNASSNQQNYIRYPNAIFVHVMSMTPRAKYGPVCIIDEPCILLAVPFA